MKNAAFFRFKIKERIGIKVDDDRGTAVEKLAAIVNFINSIQYIMGLELVNDWTSSLFMNIVTWCFLGYTMYIEFPTLSCFVLLGGSALTLTVYTSQ